MKGIDSLFILLELRYSAKSPLVYRGIRVDLKRDFINQFGGYLHSFIGAN